MTAARERASALMRLTLVEACEAVRKGEVTAVCPHRGRARRLQGRRPDDQREYCPRAGGGTADRRAPRPAAQGRPLGPLHGVPLAHKDMYYRTGKPCRCGSKIRVTFRPTYTATAI